MWTVLYIGVLRLWNNKLELCLALVVPIAFFSIFALIFSRGIGEGATDIVKLGVVNNSDTPLAERFVAQLRGIDSLQIDLLDASWASSNQSDRNAWARDYMMASDTKLILWIGPEFGLVNDDGEVAKDAASEVGSGDIASTHRGEISDARPACRLLIEGSDPIAPKIVSTLLGGLLAQLSGSQVALDLAQAASFPPNLAPEKMPAANLLAETLSADVHLPIELPSPELADALRGATLATPVLEQLASDRLFLEPLDWGDQPGKYPLATAMTPESSQAPNRWSIPNDSVPSPNPLEVRLERPDSTPSRTSAVAESRSWNLETVKVFGEKLECSKIAMYAAGIAVMFLLFSASGAGGSLLEEEEAGTLERLLTSQLTFTKLLAGKWLYITGLGSAQLTLMFAWAELVFGVPTSAHLPAFFVMTIATAGASASLSLLLAVVCRSRAQLNAVAIVLILAMSALGGSMVPRYLMSEDLQQWGQVTFNAWAIDGFHKIFWQNQSVFELSREISVMGMMTIGFALVARLLSDR